jgi:hypothetical protein
MRRDDTGYGTTSILTVAVHSPVGFCSGILQRNVGSRTWRDSPLLVYVDTSEVRLGALEELRGAIKELVEFLDANVPRVIAYNV